jgi:transposase
VASLVAKGRGEHRYWYVVSHARVDGRPRIVDQRYVGTTAEVLARLGEADPSLPDRTEHRLFGDVAAVWSLVDRLGVAEIVDEVAGGACPSPGVSCGTYIALAVANRVAGPTSKLGFADWYATTCLPRVTGVPTAALDHRRFWDAMGALTAEHLEKTEARLAARLVEDFGVDASALVLDMTNFATFIDSANEKAPLAQRGKAKQKRTDLRLVGLGLVVTRDGAIPLLSHAYPGNKPDVTQFAEMVATLARRGRRLFPGEPTLVFDAGQNSEDNLAHLATAGLRFVGSLPPSDFPALLAAPASARHPVDAQRFGGLTASETRAVALGADRRVILTHSPTLHAGQARGFDQTLAKATGKLDELAARLARGKTRRRRGAVAAEIEAICKPRWVSRVVAWELPGDDDTDPALLRLSWHVDDAARAALEEEVFGKRVLTTDHEEWPVAEVVAAYRSQSQVEGGFRQLKDRHVVSFSPLYHWTDQKIRVHLAYCVLALTVAHLMRRLAEQAGVHASVRELLDTLHGIQETTLLYQGGHGRPRTRRMITAMSAGQQRLYDLFELDRYAPSR